METMLTYNTNSNTGPVCGGRASRYCGVDAFEEFVNKFGEIQVVTINKVIAVIF